MEGRLGRLLKRIDPRGLRQRQGEDYHAYLNRHNPGLGDRLRESQEHSLQPGTAYELRGAELVPVEWPGFRPQEVPSPLGPLPTMPDVPQGGMNN